MDIQANNIIKNWIRNNNDELEVKLNDLQLSKIYIPIIIKSLNISNNNFKEFDLDTDSALTSLNISNNKLQFINTNKRLYYLNISNNLFNSINFKNNNLKILNISFNNLIVLNLTNLPNLTEINASNNKIIKIITLDTNILKFIDVSNNNLTVIDNIFSELISLKCNNNKLVKINKLNNKLQELNCENNLLKDLPNFPKSLLYININYNKIENLTYSNKYSNLIKPQLKTQIFDFYVNDKELKTIKDLYTQTIKDIIKNNSDYSSYINNLKVYSKSEKQSASDTVVMSGELNHPSLNMFEKYIAINKLNKNIFFKSYEIKNNNLLDYKFDNSLDTEIDIYNSVIYELIYNNHTPHLINYYGCNSINNVKYLVFEKLEPITLFDYLSESKTLSMMKLFIIFFQIFYTLYCLHCKHLIHNDLHMGNILVENKTTNYVYGIFDSKIEIITDTSIKIFDFDRSSCYNTMCQRNFKLDTTYCLYYNQCNGFYYKRDIAYIINNIYRILIYKFNVDLSAVFNIFFINKKNNTQLKEFCSKSPNDNTLNLLELNNITDILFNILNYFKTSKDSSGVFENTNVDYVNIYPAVSKINVIFTPPIAYNLNTYQPLLKQINFAELLTVDMLFANIYNMYLIDLSKKKYNLDEKKQQLYDIVINKFTNTNDDENKLISTICEYLVNPILYGIPNGFLIFIDMRLKPQKLQAINIYNKICEDFVILPIDILNLYGNSTYNINTSVNINSLIIAIQNCINLAKTSNYSSDNVNLIEKYLNKLTNILIKDYDKQYNSYYEYTYKLLFTEDINTDKYIYKYYFMFFYKIHEFKSNLIKLKDYLLSLNDEYINNWINEYEF